MPTPNPPAEAPRDDMSLAVECRVRERHPCELPTSCQPLAARADNDFLWPAKLRDISPSGVGLVVGRRFEPGTCLAVEFPGTGATPAEVLFARVAHATARPGGYWLLGCAFVSDLSEHEVQTVLALGQATLQAKKSESALDRFTLCSPVADHRPAPPGKTPSRTFALLGVTFQGSARDGQSATTLVRRLYVTGGWPLPAGTLVEGWAGTRAEGAAVIRLKIHNCSQQGERWTVSYSVVGTPPAEVLRSLGHPDPAGDSPGPDSAWH
jgi:PilZ domain